MARGRIDKSSIRLRESARSARCSAAALAESVCSSSIRMTPSAEVPSPRDRFRLRRAAPVVLAVVLLGFIELGHDGRRTLQMAALALPLCLWMLWPVRSTALHWLRGVLVWVGVMLFVLDGAVRHFLLSSYEAAPDSAMVLGAAANTHARESLEYLQAYWPALLARALLVAVAACVMAWAVGHAARASAAAPAWRPPRRGLAAAAAALLFVSGLAHASKPWRRLHPAVFWTQWVDSAQELRAGWSQHRQTQERAMDHARTLAPELTDAAPSTVMLVLGESINRDNMSLYGYPRATTPRLLADKAQFGDALTVLRHAWSVEASTLPALDKLFRFGHATPGEPPHLLALARAAGYKVWWIGNQDDMAVEHRHARLADEVEMVNRRPGRASDALDGELLDDVQRALHDPAPRKLVVVHLMGAHPHYRLRFPDGANPFEDAEDEVERVMRRAGRSAWTREARQDYDAAMLYHDGVLSALLGQLRGSVGDEGRGAWMYLSDHGQEVGHEVDRAGHSAATAAGYRIPALIWRSDAASRADADIADRPFRADWAAWTVADLLGMRWSGHEAARSVLHPDYRWQAPRLGVPVASFSR